MTDLNVELARALGVGETIHVVVFQAKPERDLEHPYYLGKLKKGFRHAPGKDGWFYICNESLPTTEREHYHRKVVAGVNGRRWAESSGMNTDNFDWDVVEIQL